MADLTKSVAIIFEGTDRLSRSVNSATNGLNRFTDSVDGAARPLANVTTSVLKFEAALVATGAAVTALAIKTAGDFDAQFREITTLVDEPTEALGKFRRAILDYASDSTASMEEITSSVYAAISAGVDYRQSLDAVRVAEQLSVAGKADLNDTLTVLVSSLNAYGLEMDEAARFSDALFTAVKQGQTTLPELGSSLSQVTGLAASAGVDFEELLSAVAALTAAGAPTSEAITQVRQAISGILKPTSEASKTAESLGIEFNAAALESQGLAGVLEDVADATGGNTEQISKLFGSVEALGGVLTLTGEGADAFADTLGSMANNAGSTEEAFSRMAGTVEQGNQRIANATRGLLIEIGDPLLNEFGGIQQAIASIFTAIGSSVEAGNLGQFVDQIESIMSSLEDTLQDAARNLPEALESADYSGFLDGIETVRTAVAELFDGADITSAEGLVTVIETLGGGFQLLSEFTASVIDVLEPFLQAVVDITQALSQLNPKVAAWAGGIGGAAVAIVTLNGALRILTGLLKVLGGGAAAGSIAGATRKIGGLAAALGKSGLVGAAGAAGYGIGTLANDLVINPTVNALTEDTQTLGTWIYELVNGTEDWEAELDQLGGTMGETRDKVGETNRAMSEQSNQASGAKDRTHEWMGEAQQLLRQQEGLENALISTNKEIEGQGSAIDQANRDTESAAESQNRWVKTIEDGIPVYRQVGEVFGESTDRAKKGLEEVEEASESFRLKMEEIASNERIQTMEFAVDMNIAKLEADADKVKATMEATSNTIEATTESISGLFGQMGEASRFDQLNLQRQIEEENRIRREAHEAQMDLTREQIRSLSARTEALSRGDALIRVDGTGLEPELEAFMWRILERVRTRANAEFSDYLLGIGEVSP